MNERRFNRQRLRESPLLSALKEYRNKDHNQSLLFGTAVRPLSQTEQRQLISQGNVAEDWDRVWVHEGFETGFIHGNRFTGRCVLGRYNGEMLPGKVLDSASGIYNSFLRDVEIGDSVAILSSLLDNHCLVKDSNIIVQSTIQGSAHDHHFGNGELIPLGVESGGIAMHSFAELDLADVQYLRAHWADDGLKKRFSAFIGEYLENCASKFSVIESGCAVYNAKKINSVYLSSGVVVDGAALVENSTILADPEEGVVIESGSMVKNSIIQWGCHLASGALVDSSVLTEYSGAEQNGKVIASIIGPNSTVAKGEVTASVLGPLVGFHHQSLLIGAYWPSGKGNIGYGANVGSNHTSRAPDQEIWPGEGMFFGLGCSIKYPANYRGSPYSIISTGLVTLPQKVEYPFSLIAQPAQSWGISAAYNQLIPAWVLKENIYSVFRNQLKFRARSKAGRMAVEIEVFRVDIMEMVVRARDTLMDIKSERDFYLPPELPGIGKNILLEKDRKAAIETYTFYMEYFCLRGLKKHLLGLQQGRAVYSPDVTTEYCRNMARREGFPWEDRGLKRYTEILDRILRDVKAAKKKDDIRGQKIIDDYTTSHLLFDQDDFIQELEALFHKEKDDVQALTRSL